MTLEKFRLDGKVALITGSTRGIGLAIAHTFGEAGARLVISSRSPVPEAERSLREAGYEVDFIAADLEHEQAPQQLVDAVLKRHGRIDVLVNNAGVAIHGDSGDFDEERWRRVMNLNVDAVFRGCRAVLAPMRAQGGGVILNVGRRSHDDQEPGQRAGGRAYSGECSGTRLHRNRHVAWRH
jgi:NAD(P)-dependent dehydrogenase (short-subunit alcohol dehydrogenase family)